MEFEIFEHKCNMNQENNINQNVEVEEILELIRRITEDEIIEENENYSNRTKSISKPLTNLIEEKLLNNKWEKGVLVFNDSKGDYKTERWSLDFYKNGVSVEIAFNHEEGTLWNIFKGVLAYEPNNMPKNVEINKTILITITKKLRLLGGFDGSIGTFEKYQEYLKAFSGMINYPIYLLGLKELESFFVKHKQIVNKKLVQIERRG